MISKVNSTGSGNNLKRHAKATLRGAVSGAILGVAIQSVACGVRCAKMSKVFSPKQIKSYMPVMLNSIKHNALVCAGINAGIGLAYSVYNTAKAQNANGNRLNKSL